jgi:hypothetical protein
MAFTPPGTKRLARVVNRCMSNKARSFMVKQGRADSCQAQDLSIVLFHTISNNSQPISQPISHIVKSPENFAGCRVRLRLHLSVFACSPGEKD